MTSHPVDPFARPASPSRSSSHLYRRVSFALLLASIISITYIASTAQGVPGPSHVVPALGSHLANLKATYAITHVPGDAEQKVQMQEEGEERGGTRIRYRDGIAYVDKLGQRHPMEEKFELGQRKAEEVQSKIDSVRIGGLKAAVDDYREAYNMDPPEGFDVWYQLAIDLNTTSAPSLYPLAHKSVLPFLALPPAILRERAYKTTEQQSLFGMVLPPGASNVSLVNMDNLCWLKTLHKEWADLIIPHLDKLPPSPNANKSDHVMLPIWVDDTAHHTPSWEILSKSRMLAQKGQVWDMKQLQALEASEGKKKGWRGHACHNRKTQADGHARLAERRAESDRMPSFVSDPAVYMDPCLHPEHLVQNGEMISKEEWTVKGLIPMASLNTPVGGGEIIGPTSVGTKKLYEPVPWSQKTDPRIWFRGNPNSAFVYTGWNWRASQRFRLSDFATPARAGLRESVEEVKEDIERLEGENTSKVGETMLDVGDSYLNRLATIQPERLGVLSRDSGSDQWARKDVDRIEEVQRTMNVSLINFNTRWPCGEFHAPFYYCLVENDQTDKRPDCPMKPQVCQPLIHEYSLANITRGYKDTQQYKFRLDLDGFAWTTRFRSELSTGSVVLKATLYPEWWSAQAIPWYHYIPVRYDFVDLFDIVGYFTGRHEQQTDSPSGSPAKRQLNQLNGSDATVIPRGGSKRTSHARHRQLARRSSLTATTARASGEQGHAEGEEQGSGSSPVRPDAGGELQTLSWPEELQRRDAIAEGIAQRGRSFALDRMRSEGMQVYWFLLLLEYRRAWADDRQAATYKP